MLPPAAQSRIPSRDQPRAHDDDGRMQMHAFPPPAPGALNNDNRGFTNYPAAQGLYDPKYDHDACGVAFVATLTGVPSHDIVSQALTALRNVFTNADL